MDNKLLISVLRKVSNMILENGGETYRAEESVIHIVNRFGVSEIDVLAIPTGIIFTLEDETHQGVTVIKRVKKRTVDLYKIDAVNNISRQLACGNMTLEEADKRLDELTRPFTHRRLKSTISAALASGFFAMLFGGDWMCFFAAMLAGGLVQFIATTFKREDMFHFIISMIGGMVCSAIAVATHIMFPWVSADKIILGSIMPLLPGLAMTNAIRDAMRGDLVSGGARAAESLVVALAIAIGVSIVLRLYFMNGGAISL